MAGDRADGDGRAGSESRSGDARCQTAAAGEPLQGVSNTGAVHTPGADAADCGCGIQHGKRAGDRVDRPGDGHQEGATHHHPARAEPVDEITLDGNQPGLNEYKQCEGHLDRGPTPVIFLINRIDEQRPAILEIGNAGHADDADSQLQPWIPECSPTPTEFAFMVRSPLRFLDQRSAALRGWYIIFFGFV